MGRNSAANRATGDKTVTMPNGEARTRGNKAGKGRSYLPVGHPMRTHDRGGPNYRRRVKRVNDNMQEWFDRKHGRGKKRKEN